MSLISIWWWSQGTQNVNYCQQESKYIDRKKDVKEKHDYNKKWRIIKLYFKIWVILHIQIHQVIYDRLAAWIRFDKWSINKFFYVVKFKIYRFMVNIFLVLVKHTIYWLLSIYDNFFKRIKKNLPKTLENSFVRYYTNRWYYIDKIELINFPNI